MKKQLLLLVFLIANLSFAQGILTPVDRLKIKTPNELPNNTQVLTRSTTGTTTGETGYVLKTELQDVLKYATASALPVTGVGGRLYYTIDSMKYYSWNGTIYNEAVASVNGQTGVVSLTLQNVLDAGNTSTNGVTVNTTDFVGVNSTSSGLGVVSYGSVVGMQSTGGTGLIARGSSLGLKVSSDGVVAKFNLENGSNTNNISEWIKNNDLQASISHNGILTAKGASLSGDITATNLSGTNKGDQSENNVYLSHDFLASNGNDFISFNAVNSGTFGLAPFSVASLNNPGTGRITSSTNANSGLGIRSTSNLYILKGGEVFTEIINPLVFTNTVSRIGLHDSTSSSDANNGVYFEISTSGDLTLKTANNGTRTTSATIATLSVSTWYKVRFTVNAGATSVLGEVFNASGVLITSVTQTTNIPTTARQLNVCSITTNSGTTATALIDVDFMSLKTTLTR